MGVPLPASMSGSKVLRWLVLGVVGLAVLLMVAPSVPYGIARALGAAVTPATVSGDPLINTNWAGYGVRPSTINTPILDILGSWVVPNVTCPNVTPAANVYALASEAIGAGLDHWAGGGGLRMDGAGVLIVCVQGRALYFAWDEEAPLPAVVIGGFIPHPGDVFQANVTLSGWSLRDLTTPQAAAGIWTTPLSAKLAHNSAECVVARGTSLGVLPSVFLPVPASVPTKLTNPVEFGSLFATPSPAIGPAAGCWYSAALATGAPGPWVGIGTAPTPPVIGYTFQMLNPNAANLIVPGPLMSGLLPNDSFIVP